MPYSQYFCNFTQLYLGACVIYIITLINVVQSFAPQVNQMIKYAPITCAVKTLSLY